MKAVVDEDGSLAHQIRLNSPYQYKLILLQKNEVKTYGL